METVIQLEQKIRERVALKGSGLTRSRRPAVGQTTKASADEWGRLARYAALLQKNEGLFL